VLQLAGWLAVELLALNRGGCVAVSWLAGCDVVSRAGVPLLIA
jgi:hypothetical protein